MAHCCFPTPCGTHYSVRLNGIMISRRDTRPRIEQDNYAMTISLFPAARVFGPCVFVVAPLNRVVSMSDASQEWELRLPGGRHHKNEEEEVRFRWQDRPALQLSFQYHRGVHEALFPRLHVFLSCGAQSADHR